MEAHLKGRCCRIHMDGCPATIIGQNNMFTGCSNLATHYAIIDRNNIIKGYCDRCWPDFQNQVKELNQEEVFVASILMA